MFSAEYNTVALPGGYFDAAGVRHCDVRFRPLNGHDQEWFAGLPAEFAQASFVTRLLSHTVRSVGPYRATRQLVSDLLVADREFLLLKLHEISFGSRVDMTLTCPRAGCGASMDISFGISGIPIERGEPAAYHTLPGTDIVFRLPRGSDQEDAAANNASDADAVTRLLHRCVIQSSADFAPQTLADHIARLAPRVDFEMETICPECGATSSRLFDPTAWFISDLFRRHADFEREIHLLGLHYHWPLRELLGLARARRSRYVHLLTGELDRQAEASFA